MKIIEPKVTIEQMPTHRQALLIVERAARTCYKSEDKGGTEASAEKLIRSCLTRKPAPHESVIEHVVATVRFVVDRGVTHEIVRHRLCSFSQESTRYCNYSGDKFGNEVTFINPCFWGDGSTDSYDNRIDWEEAMAFAEKKYLLMTARGCKPEQARSVLPNSLKTEIVWTANFRQWRHIFSLRCSPAAHPQMRQVMRPLLAEFIKRHPVFFDSLPTVGDVLLTGDRPEVEIAEELIAA